MVRRFVSQLSAVAAFLAIASGAAAQGGSIAGKVTDADGGKPVSGARVQAVSGLRTAATVASGEDGSYRITGLEAGTYAVIATRIGYAAKRADGVDVSAGATATADFALMQIAARLNEVVTTASRGAEAQKLLDAPASISVVSSEKLSSTPAPTIADALMTTPGLSVSTGGIVQSNTVSRGFNNAFSGSMLMLQDYRFAGVPSLRVNVPVLLTGTSDDIERIEVLNGPASALYGPNSANGVINIITKSPFTSQGTMISLDGGSQSIVRGAFRHAGVFGEGKWGYKFSGEYMSGTDFAYTDPNEPTVFPSTAPSGRAGTPNVRDLNVRRYSGEARLDYRNAGVENTLTAGYTKLGSALEITTAFGAVQAKNWSYSNFQDRFRYKRFFAQVFYNDNNSGNSGPGDLSGTYYLRTGLPVVDQSKVIVEQVQQGFDVGKAKMVAGIDNILTLPRSQGTIFGRNEGSTDITEVGAYLQSTIPLTPKLDLVTAVRGDQTNRLTGYQFSPHAAFVYKYNDLNNIRLTFSRAFNSPASFEYFLDQINSPNAAPGFNVQAIGNPSKLGWQFNRSCDATVNTGICMHSPWMAAGPTTAVASSAALAFPGFIAALPSIINGLPTLSATQKAQLTGLFASLNPILSHLQPTPAQVGTTLYLGGKPIAASQVADLQPLSASFNNTWELGYKGIIADKLRIALDLWYQIRGDVGAPIGQANPTVQYEPGSLGAYLATNITQGLMAGGMPQAQAVATASAAAGALVPLMAALPQGTLAFTNAKLANDQSIIATYTNGFGQVDVHGLDLAIDYQLNENWLLAATYSNQDKIVFPSIGGLANPLMSNSPKHRATGSARYTNDATGWGVDLTLRYADAFPVNSGVFNSLNPNPYGGATYSPVPAQTMFDFGVNWRLPIASKVNWSLNVTNAFDNKVATFVGTPAIGRIILTRIKYDF